MSMRSLNHSKCGWHARPTSTVDVQSQPHVSLGSGRRKTITHASTNVREMSRQMKDVRSRMEEDANLKVLMESLRGSNLSNADFADASVEMRLVNVMNVGDEGDVLPLEYDPELIKDYWNRRPVSVISRVIQLLGIAGGFLGGLLVDFLNGNINEKQVERAIELRNIMTSLGPAYIKLGQALSIRPDILSPAAMNEMQKLCDKVPSFPSDIAMQQLEQELGKPWYEIYSELTPEPIAAASLGQVYRGKLKSGEAVAVKVQRPGVLETVTVDLFIIREFGMFLRNFPQVTARADIVGLLDEWAARFFEELDYVREGNNATRFAEMMRDDLPQVVVPATFHEFTSRRVLTSEWLDGEKLSQSEADDVGKLVNVGVICYLKQLLDTGFFHADPHPGNLIRTPDGRLAILDFGLMTQVDDDIKYGMIEAISHLVHRDYEAIVEDFVTLDFIPPGTDLKPILPVLSRVFDQALEGGGAKNINFQDLAADLANITFEYPFRIPPYFALIIRAIGVLEGIALVGNPDFALVDEAFPFISKRLMTDDSPRLREALRYMVYGKAGIFDADRLIDLLDAFEAFTEASRSARGQLDLDEVIVSDRRGTVDSSEVSLRRATQWLQPPQMATAALTLMFTPLVTLNDAVAVNTKEDDNRMSEALKFLLSPEGAFFRDFLMEEAVKSIDALSRKQFREFLSVIGLENALIPVLLPGAQQRLLPVAPPLDEEEEQVVRNVAKVVTFLVGGRPGQLIPSLISTSTLELLPLLPGLGSEILPELTRRLASRIMAKALREVFVA